MTRRKNSKISQRRKTNRISKESNKPSQKEKELQEFLDKYEKDELNAQDVIKKNEEKKKKERVAETNEEVHQSKIHKRKKSKISVKGKASSVKESVLSAKKDIKKAKNKAGKKIKSLKASSSKGTQTNPKSPKKKKHRILKGILIGIGSIFLVFCGYAIYCVASAPSIDTDDLYSHLQVSSVMYDDSGKAVTSVSSGENRSLVEYKDLPKNLINAFVAIEDKTFWEHHGFNFIRILGAIKDSILGGGGISGTSTITQQLARNIYLPDEKSERSLRRKIVEAYYTMELESKLSKEEIITAYLNTISLGFHSYGVQAASRTYFNCDVSQLTLEQCAALAALPQAPTKYALVVECKNNELAKDDIIIKKGSSTSFILNDTSKNRRETCLDLMLEQEKITQAEHDKAKAVPLEKMLDVNVTALSEHEANYFAEYIADQVIADLEKEGYSYETAFKKVYSEGLKIYTTMDSKAQEACNDAFNNPDNFPSVGSYNSDNQDNIIDESQNILLYNYNNLFDENGTFKFNDDEYRFNSDGSLTLFYGKRLNIYKTTVESGIDYSVEFKNMFTIEDGRFYSIAGGYINIPADAKKVDDDMNVTISAQFLKDNPNFFNTSDGLSLPENSYKLNQKVVQPQGAMVIRDVRNGQIKAMIGGRELTGEKLFNRATTTRQPGSSIKPITVYSAALQYSADALSQGEKSLEFVNPGGTAQGDKYWGNFLTAASTVIDEKMTVDGKVWPQNVHNNYSGVISMRKALQESVNVSAVKVYQQIGADYSSENAKNLGISTLVTDTDKEANDMNAAALALGGTTDGVTPLEMSNAFTAFVNGGKVYDSTCYTKVEDSFGNMLLEKKEIKDKQALDPGVAWITRDMLFDVVDGGTGSSASISDTKVGGKTGTTTDEKDIWFNGFTPTYAASLWIGNDMNMELTSMSEYAASLWSTIMSEIPNACSGEYSSAPSNVISVSVDAYSGGLPASGASTKTEYFIKGTEPTSVIKIDYTTPSTEDKNDKKDDKKDKTSDEPTVNICSETGFYATPLCPHQTTIKLADLDPSKMYYCNKHNPDPEKYITGP